MPVTEPGTTTPRPDLEPLFRPRSVAVVGASPDLGKPGGRCLDYLLRFGFSGAIYPINPNRATIAAITTYPSLRAVPGPIDLVLILIAAEQVPAALEEAAAAGARAAVVFSSGFREVGAEGAELERRLVEAAARHGLAVLGPNCLGFVDVDARLPATFSTALQLIEQPATGPIAFVSQSGAMGAAIFGLAQSLGVGVGMFVSTGNESIIDFQAVFNRVAADPRVSVILGYIEGIRDGRAFVSAVREARCNSKDVAVLKVGRSDAGRVAAQTHTGAMAGSEEAWNAALDRAGAIRASGPSHLLDIGSALQGGSRAGGPRLGVITMSGGAGVLITDRATELGLSVPPLSEATRERLSRLLPAGCSLANPVDFGAAYGSADLIAATVRCVAESPDVDIVLVFLGLSSNLAGAIEPLLVDVRSAIATPMVICWLGGPAHALLRLRTAGLPAYDDPLRAVAVAALLHDAASPLAEDLPLPPSGSRLQRRLAAAASSGRQVLSEPEAKALLADYGLPIIAEAVAQSADEATAITAAWGGPVAVKAIAADLIHKSDAGAVLLGVGSGDAASAFGAVTEAAQRAGATPTGVLIARMASADRTELLVGSRWDEQFGPLVVVGAGGMTSEVDHDVAVDLAPVSADRASELIRSLRIAPMLTGFRSQPPRDLAAAADAVAAVSRFAADAGPTLRELDINPLAVYAAGGGCLVLDATATIGRIS
jgi:acyl-CoA synthetase (NDP forming)